MRVSAGTPGITPSLPPTSSKEGQFRYGNQLTGQVGVAWRALDALDLVGETYGTYLLDDFSDKKQKFTRSSSAASSSSSSATATSCSAPGPRYTTGFEAADLRGFLGFIFEPSIGDRDGDGIKDDVDKCPDEPEDFDGFQDEDGCPDPDNDNDGILDVDDRCPNEPEDHDGDRGRRRLPRGSDGDRDGDGILGLARTSAPTMPEDKDGFEDDDGCPEPDNDKDGIPDKQRHCPNDPEDKDGFEDDDGCPIRTTTTTASST